MRNLPNPLVVRRARPDEANALTALILRSKQSNGYDSGFMRACQDELTVGSMDIRQCDAWLAWIDGPVGFAALESGTQIKGWGVVSLFFVDPDSHRQGVGRRLWKKLLETANASHYKGLYLDADPNAEPFYRALGFETVSQVPSGSIAGRTLPRMHLRLPQ